MGTVKHWALEYIRKRNGKPQYVHIITERGLSLTTKKNKARLFSGKSHALGYMPPTMLDLVDAAPVHTLVD